MILKTFLVHNSRINKNIPSKHLKITPKLKIVNFEIYYYGPSKNTGSMTVYYVKTFKHNSFTIPTWLIQFNKIYTQFISKSTNETKNSKEKKQQNKKKQNCFLYGSKNYFHKTEILLFIHYIRETS